GHPLVIIRAIILEQDFESLGALGSGRTIPSWRMVVDAETAKLKKFQDFLRVEDKLVFHDLLGQCKLYAPYASTMASPVKEVPLLISMLFGQRSEERRVGKECRSRGSS